MRNKVLQNLLRRILNIHIPPIHPAVIRLQRRIQQIVPRLPHRLPSGTLKLEAMARLHILPLNNPKILLNNHDATKRDFRIRVILDPLQLGCEQRHSIVRGVADQERQVDQVMWVR